MNKYHLTYQVDNRIIEKTVMVPTSWSETTFKQYAALDELGKKPDIISVIAALTGIEPSDLMKMEYNAILFLSNSVKYSFDISGLYAFNIVPDEFLEWTNPKTGKVEQWDIGLQPTEKMIQVDNALRELVNSGHKPSTMFICEELCRQYADMEIAEKPITEVLGLCNFFLSSMQRLKRDMSIFQNGKQELMSMEMNTN